MKQVIRKALRSVDALFDLTPRGRSEAGLRVSEMRKVIRHSQDRLAMRDDFYRVGEYIRSAMVKYGEKSA